jgi:hypothetical protein
VGKSPARVENDEAGRGSSGVEGNLPFFGIPSQARNDGWCEPAHWMNNAATAIRTSPAQLGLIATAGRSSTSTNVLSGYWRLAPFPESSVNYYGALL